MARLALAQGEIRRAAWWAPRDVSAAGAVEAVREPPCGSGALARYTMALTMVQL